VNIRPIVIAYRSADDLRAGGPARPRRYVFAG
jgi:hypothetical protein